MNVAIFWDKAPGSFSTLKMEVISPSDTPTYELHCNISQKMAAFITTAVRISDPT
jgi:hypothetical protein